MEIFSIMEKRMKPLPDTETWIPRKDKEKALRNTLLQTCRSVEARIIAEADIEKKFNIDNYDSGLGVEDIAKQELQKLLPGRYEIMPGVVIDGNGHTCGECDLVIVNKFWIPSLKYGATDKSRRLHIPVESVYSVIEVKQTLTEDSLDKAMEKIVQYKSLERPRSEYGRIIENHNIQGLDKPEKSLNYRFDIILAVWCKKPETLVKRFFLINESLPLDKRINALALLGYGYVFYVAGNNLNACLYPDQHKKEELATFYIPTETDTFYYLYANLWQHLTLTVLNPYDFKHKYGTGAKKEGDCFKPFLSS